MMASRYSILQLSASLQRAACPLKIQFVSSVYSRTTNVDKVKVGRSQWSPVRITGADEAPAKLITARITSIARITRIAWITRITRIARIARITRIAGITRIARIVRITRIADIARIARIARNTRIARITDEGNKIQFSLKILSDQWESSIYVCWYLIG